MILVSKSNKQEEREMTEVEVQELIESVLDGIDEMSPYRFSKVVSRVVGYKVQPQMIYSYVKKNYIKSYLNSLDHLVINHDEMINFLTKFATKVLVKSDEE
jgi:hypothetical protein